MRKNQIILTPGSKFLFAEQLMVVSLEQTIQTAQVLTFQCKMYSGKTASQCTRGENGEMYSRAAT